MPRRLHALRPRGLRPQAQRGQRPPQPRRCRRQPLVELRLRRRRRCARPTSLGAAPAPAAQRLVPAGDVARDADGGDGRRVRPDPGRQQQRLQPGQRDVVGRLGSARARSPTSSASSAALLAAATPPPAAVAARLVGRRRAVVRDVRSGRPRRRRARSPGTSATSTSSPTPSGSRWTFAIQAPGPWRAHRRHRRWPSPDDIVEPSAASPPWTATYDVAARSRRDPRTLTTSRSSAIASVQRPIRHLYVARPLWSVTGGDLAAVTAVSATAASPRGGADRSGSTLARSAACRRESGRGEHRQRSAPSSVTRSASTALGRAGRCGRTTSATRSTAQPVLVGA